MVKYIPGRFLRIPYVLLTMVPRNKKMRGMHVYACIPLVKPSSIERKTNTPKIDRRIHERVR